VNHPASDRTPSCKIVQISPSGQPLGERRQLAGLLRVLEVGGTQSVQVCGPAMNHDPLFAYISLNEKNFVRRNTSRKSGPTRRTGERPVTLRRVDSSRSRVAAGPALPPAGPRVAAGATSATRTYRTKRVPLPGLAGSRAWRSGVPDRHARDHHGRPRAVPGSPCGHSGHTARAGRAGRAGVPAARPAARSRGRPHASCRRAVLRGRCACYYES
jgi:hypothetical protein